MFLVFSNQSFPAEVFKKYKKEKIVLLEAIEFFNEPKCHKHKILLHLSALRSTADLLARQGFNVSPFLFKAKEPPRELEHSLELIIEEFSPRKIVTFQIEDHDFRARVQRFCHQKKMKLEFVDNPMFLTSLSEFQNYLQQQKDSQPHMRGFYQQRRRELKILMEKNGEAKGGQFFFDSVNPLRLARDIHPPQPPRPTATKFLKEAAEIVETHFLSHPGHMNEFWYPTTRLEALTWLADFVQNRLALYGDYEDALSTHSDLIYHSALSALLNVGLLTPDEVIEAAVEHGLKERVALHSIEPFVRHILGWREFLRGMYHQTNGAIKTSNFWKHERLLKQVWFDGTTGIPVLDDLIKKASRLAYNHPMERLMVLSNMMLLCEVHPLEIYRWSMQMYADSADWITSTAAMGLGQFADGGVLSSRPYVCGAAYMKRVSHYADGPWCEILDGLYWSFVEKHRDIFSANPRTAVALPTLNKLDPHRKEIIFTAARTFKEKVTSL